MTADTASPTAPFFGVVMRGLPDGYHLPLWRFDTRAHEWVTDPAQAAAHAEAVDSEGVDVYATPAYWPLGHGGERTKNTTAGLLGPCLDLDVNGSPDRDGNEKTGAAPSVREAWDLAKSIATPTFVVLTGGGIQPWWLFDEPWTFATDDEREEAAAFTKAWEQAHRDLVAWRIDPTHDLPHLRRVPGTRNFKGEEPRPVKVKPPKGWRRWPIADLRAMVPAGHSTPKKAAPTSLNGHGDVDPDRRAVLLAWPGVVAIVDGGKVRFGNDASKRDHALSKELVRAGATDAEGSEIIGEVRLAEDDPKNKADRPDYGLRTMANGRAEVAAEDAGVIPATASAIKPECLVQDVAGFVGQFVVMTPEKLLAVALWVIHTHCVAQFDQTPYLAVTSPEKQCGKSRLLEVLELLVHRPWQTVLPSEAVVFRTIDSKVPTMLLDETDAIFNPKSAERYEGLRAILNSGHRRGATVARCVGPRQQLQDFSTFCPKVLAGIGSLPDTIADRSVPVRLERKKRGEVADRFFRREAEPRGRDLQSRMLAWCNAEGETLRAARPPMPDELSDRMQEGCEPLVAIADVLGCGEDARAAFVELLTAERLDNVETLRLRLLRDIRDVFGARTRTTSTEGLIKKLLREDESPWGSYYGRAVEARDLSRLLAPYGIHPATVRVSKERTAKGYRRDDFADAWERYL
jgi:hypothetical protein